MKKTQRWIIILCLVIFTAVMTGCQGNFSVNIPDSRFIENFSYNEYPIERAGISLHLDRAAKDGTEPKKIILMIHGVTYSSHEFDINYKDYSLVRFLTGEGYAVWRLDIAGFGQSEEVVSIVLGLICMLCQNWLVPIPQFRPVSNLGSFARIQSHNDFAGIAVSMIGIISCQISRRFDFWHFHLGTVVMVAQIYQQIHIADPAP